MHSEQGAVVQFLLSRFKSWIFHARTRERDVINMDSQLMERLSHELRTSLTGIVGYSEFVESTSAEPMVNFTAKIIRESSQNLARTSNSFFDLHRLEQGQMQVECSNFSISDLVRDVVRLNQTVATERGVHLFATCSEDTYLSQMNSDAQKVRQVMDALVFAAVQSAASGQSVQVDVSLDEAKHLMRLVLTSQVPFYGSAQHQLLKDFWHSKCYQFRLQEGPGVELALAKEMIAFLRGEAEYLSTPQKPSQLVVKLPMHHHGQSRNVL